MKIPLHTPYKNGKGGVKVGLEPVEELKWIEIDELFSSEIAQKENLYKTKHQDVYQETPNSFESQEEFLNILREHLLEYHPEHLIQNESKRNQDISVEHMHFPHIRLWENKFSIFQTIPPSLYNTLGIFVFTRSR